MNEGLGGPRGLAHFVPNSISCLGQKVFDLDIIRFYRTSSVLSINA